MALSDDLAGLEWLPPWAPVDAARARECEHELERRLGPQHALRGRVVRALARRIDEVPDTLFLLREPDCLWLVPATGSLAANGGELATFEDIAGFATACMLPDHLEYTDDDV
jgi:hypothetical protein